MRTLYENITDRADLNDGDRIRVTYSNATRIIGEATIEGVVQKDAVSDITMIDDNGNARRLVSVDASDPGPSKIWWDGISSIFRVVPVIEPVTENGDSVEDIHNKYGAMLRENNDTIDKLRDIVRSITVQRDATQQEAADLRAEVGAEVVRVAEDQGWDMDAVESMLDNLGIEMPNPSPVTITYTLDITVVATPGDRETVKRMDAYDSDSFLESALTGLDQIDLDPSNFEVDMFKGVDIEFRDIEVSDRY